MRLIDYGKSNRSAFQDRGGKQFIRGKKGDHVIVETARGIEFGTVVSEPKEMEGDKIIQPLKPVLRIATPKDMEQEAANKAKEKVAFRYQAH